MNGRSRLVPRMRPVWSGWWVPVALLLAALWAALLRIAGR